MKTTKIVTIATAITIALIALCGIATANAEVGDRGEFYPRLAVVTSYEKVGDLWIIDCTDKNGMTWSFYGEEEDAHVGILFNILMWSMNEVEEEDEVVEVYYEGRLTPTEMIKFLP